MKHSIWCILEFNYLVLLNHNFVPVVLILLCHVCWLVLNYYAQELRERIKPYFLRRLKSEVFINSGAKEDKKAPQKNELIIWLKLTSCQVAVLMQSSVLFIELIKVFVCVVVLI